MSQAYSLHSSKIDKVIPYSKPSLSKKELVSVLNCMISDELSYGKIVRRFEKEFIRSFNFRHGLSVNSLTAAYHLSFLALDLQNNDEIIASSLSSLAVCDSASYVKAKVIPLDIEKKSIYPSLENILNNINDNTKVIILEHKYGYYCPYTEELDRSISKLNENRENRIYIVEDYSSVLGRELENEYAGSIGKIGICSFAGEQMITTGQGAMLTMSDSKLFAKIGQSRPVGKRKPGDIRYDYYLSDLQASMGLEQLNNLPLFLERRQKLATVLLKELKRSKCENYFNGESNSYLHFPILSPSTPEKAERVFKSMHIETASVVEMPLHYFQGQNRMDFPNTERFFRRGVLLPFYPGLRKSHLERISMALRSLI